MGGDGAAGVGGGGHDDVDRAALAAHGRAVHLDGLAAHEGAGGVEEVHAVLDVDAAAAGGVPEPVAGAQVLVGGVVLEGEAHQRVQQPFLAQPPEHPQDGVVAQDVVDDEDAGGAFGLGLHPQGVLQRHGQRLLAEHVPARAQRRRRVPRGWPGSGDRHDVHPAQARQRRGVGGDGGAVPPREGGGTVTVGVGAGHDAYAGQVGHGVQQVGAERAAAGQAQTERGHSARSRRATPMWASAMP